MVVPAPAADRRAAACASAPAAAACCRHSCSPDTGLQVPWLECKPGLRLGVRETRAMTVQACYMHCSLLCIFISYSKSAVTPQFRSPFHSHLELPLLGAL